MRLTGVVFSTLLVALSITTAKAAEIEVINPRALFPEGPVMSGGKLLYVEYAGNTVDVWDGKSNTQFWKQDGCGPSAIVPIGSNFGITCYDSGQLVVISADGTILKAYEADAGGGKLQGPNDGAPDGKGGAYFTLSGPWEPGPIVGRLVHLDKDGKLAQEVANDLHYANGIVIGPDGRLYRERSEAGRVISFKIEPDGTLSDRRLFVLCTRWVSRLPHIRMDQGRAKRQLLHRSVQCGRYPRDIAGWQDPGHPQGSLGSSTQMTFSEDGKIMFVMAVDNTPGSAL